MASHATGEHNQGGDDAARTYRATGMPLTLRDSGAFAQVAFGGLELVDPGVVLVSEWRRDAPGPPPLPSEINGYGGVARKR